MQTMDLCLTLERAVPGLPLATRFKVLISFSQLYIIIDNNYYVKIVKYPEFTVKNRIVNLGYKSITGPR